MTVSSIIQGGRALRACKRRSYFDLVLRGHGGNDPGEGTIKARHLQWPLSSVVVGRFFLRQPPEIDSGCFPNPLARVALVPLVSIAVERHGASSKADRDQQRNPSLRD